MGMRCSVIIPCYNGMDLTRACVLSLVAQTGSHELEILLVDNGSTDGTHHLDGLHPSVRVLRQPRNLGFAGGVNAGIRAARHPLLLILNNDTQAAPNLLDELWQVLASDPRIGAAAPVSNHVKGPAMLPVGNLGRDSTARAELAHELATATTAAIQDVDTLAGLCLLLRRTTLDSVGLFDERFGHGNFEDDDLCLRLRLHGYRLVIARRAFLHHEGHATFRAMGLELAEQILQRRAQFIAKWQQDPAGRATIAAMHGDLEGAAAAATEAQRCWPEWPEADWHLGRQFAATGEATRAAHHFAAVLRSCPRHSDAAVELALQQLAAGNTAAAQRGLDGTLRHCHLAMPDQVRLLRRLGEHAHHQRRWADAAANFRAALELAPADGVLHNWLGLCQLELGNLDAAIDAFDTAIEHGFALAHTNRGICRHRRGESESALADFEKAVLLLPNDRVARNNHSALRQHLAAGQRSAVAPAGASAASSTSSATIDSIEALGTQPIA